MSGSRSAGWWEVEDSRSPWVSPVVLDRKRARQRRSWSDSGRLGSVAEKGSHPPSHGRTSRQARPCLAHLTFSKRLVAGGRGGAGENSLVAVTYIRASPVLWTHRGADRQGPCHVYAAFDVAASVTPSGFCRVLSVPALFLSVMCFMDMTWCSFQLVVSCCPGNRFYLSCPARWHLVYCHCVPLLLQGGVEAEDICSFHHHVRFFQIGDTLIITVFIGETKAFSPAFPQKWGFYGRLKLPEKNKN